ncbi:MULTISPECIES: hypothetical protein [Pelosinus]|jgi:hypothetical protein|uniref:Uncharacterized protein n=1 Tax=Pelosinus fermentans B4 TaxID=1149862 RepID=I9AU78_9FIRM|nr:MULTISPECIES: hypothetical protein [Pelosinus]EIW16512.1 hypothetical protein FB4_1023 [Pelosinus fermentans B4]EIW22507.1 hypothetical protein FA11_0090 [Pelosinus fermentans A11]OAM95819.1 hypothetical protein FR7_03840 [Pelosinus fermentans DSM 17108]SDR33162.1 hypothetical protein SAMN04515679_3987 [Pelosinus fermentans]
MNEEEKLENSNLDEGKYNLKMLIIVAVISLVTGSAAGLTLGYVLGEGDRQALAVEKNKPPIIKETIKTITDTKFQYIPGETVYLPGEVKEVLVMPVDKETPGATPVKLDGKFDLGKQSFIYMVNGRVGKFDKTEEEKFVFEKNMIDLKQTSTITIEAEIPTIDLTRHNVITVGAMFTRGKIEPGIGYTGSIGKVGAYQLAGSQSAAYVGAGLKF